MTADVIIPWLGISLNVGNSGDGTFIMNDVFLALRWNQKHWNVHRSLWKFQFHLVVIACVQVLSSIVDQDDYTGFAGTQVWTRAPRA